MIYVHSSLDLSLKLLFSLGFDSSFYSVISSAVVKVVTVRKSLLFFVTWKNLLVCLLTEQ